MPAIKVTVLVEKDGQPLQGYPYVRRLVVDELQVFDPYEKANDGDTTTFTTLPVNLIDTLQALLVRADKEVTVRLDGQASAGITIKPGGLLLVFDATIDAAAATNATINNNSGAAAAVRGFGGGT